MKVPIVILLLFYHFCAFSQNDSTIILTYQDYIEMVKDEHPMAKRADLKLYEGKAALLYARGAFDPKIYTDVGQKYFKNKQYYSQINGGLKIPTWFGIELKGGYEQNQGTFLNPENSTPNNGLLYGGISIPIGQGLFIDERRAALKKARLFKGISEMEKQILLNELIYAAGSTYWKWFKSYHTLLVYKEAYSLSHERLKAVKLGAELGDRPTIDTLEASIQVQNRKLALQQSQLEFTNSSALLSTFLWAEGIVPLEVATGTVPESREIVSVTDTSAALLIQMDSLINSHPELNQSRFKIKQLEVDKRLKREQLKPQLNLKYNPITEYVGNESFENFTINNYTWGLAFQVPIFLRKERGALKLANLKLQESNLKISNKQEIIRYKAIAARNEWDTTKQQIDLYAQTVDNSRNLLKGEQQLFDLGESSLFLVNSREVGYIKTQLKFIELLTKNKNAELMTIYTLGGLLD